MNRNRGRKDTKLKKRTLQKPSEKPIPKKPNPFWTKSWAAPLTILAIFGMVYAFFFNMKPDTGGDNATYFILGKALSTGQGYTDIHSPGNPPANHFPPGYPLILAAFMYISDTVFFLKMVSGLFFAGSLLLFYKLFLKISGQHFVSFFTVLLILINVHMLGYSSKMMSEVPYLFFSVWALLLFIHCQEKNEYFRSWQFYALIVVSVFSFHIRTAGIALVGGLSVYLLFSKNFKVLAGYLAGFIILSLPWYLRGQSLGGTQYLQQLAMKNPYRPMEGDMGFVDWVFRFFDNLGRYISMEIPYSVIPMLKPDYREFSGFNEYALGLIVLAILIYGLVKLPRFRQVIVWYLIGSFMILLLWPEVWFGVRFMLPLIPILTFAGVWCIWYLLSKLKSSMRGSGTLNPGWLLLLLLIFIPSLAKHKSEIEEPLHARYREYFEVAQWAGKNLPENTIVSCRKPSFFFMYSGTKLKTLSYPYTFNPQEIFEYFKENNVEYVVVDQLGFSSTGMYLAPAIMNNMDKFEILIQTEKTSTYFLKFNYEIGYTGQYIIMKNEDQYLSLREGEGTYIYPNGEVYEGQWEKNERHGEGTLYGPDGEVLKQGKWENDIFAGF